MNLNISPMEHQVSALTDFSTRFLGVSGGKRSGKTRMITVMKAIMLTSLHPGKPGLIASPTFGMTRRNIIPLFREIAEELGIEIDGLGVKAPGTLTIKWGELISTIHLDVTIENPARLNGMSLAWAICDEVDMARFEDAQAFVEELTIRVSNPYPGQNAQVILTGAPELNSFLGEFFIENPAPDRKLYTWSMLDNHLLSEEYIQSIIKNIPASKREAWVHGRFMYDGDGLVYSDFDPVLNHTDLTINDLHPSEKIWVSFDINAGGMNPLLCVNRGAFSFVIDEWPKMASTSAVIDKVLLQPWAKRAIITCDPASQALQPYIQKSGLEMRIMKAAPLVDWRVTAVNIGFGTEAPYSPGVEKRKLLINTNKCKVLVKCLGRQKYVKGSPDKKTFVAEAGTDISGPLDSLGYFYYLCHPFQPNGMTKPIRMAGF